MNDSTQTVGMGRWPALLAVPLIAAVTMLTLTWDAPARQTPPDEGRASESQPATSPAEAEPARRPPTAEEVVKALQGIAPAGRPVIPPALPSGLERHAGGDEDGEGNVIRRGGRLLPEGYRIARRPGRLVPAEGWGWAVAFEERGRGAVDRPMRLLPNRFLEQMEAASEAGTQAVVFEVSGTVTEYRGENYLLVDFLMIRPNLGNLK